MQHASTSCRHSLSGWHGGGRALGTHQSQVAPPQPICCVHHRSVNRFMAHTRRHQRRNLSQDWQRNYKSSAQLRLAAASPALDSSGGDLPPISQNPKATAEGDDDGENNSTQDIESVLAKVNPVPGGSSAGQSTTLH